MTGETQLERRVRDLEVGHTETNTLLKEHVKSCDARNALILKLVLWGFLGILVLVVEQTFNLHVPSNLPIP